MNKENDGSDYDEHDDDVVSVSSSSESSPKKRKVTTKKKPTKKRGSQKNNERKSKKQKNDNDDDDEDDDDDDDSDDDSSEAAKCGILLKVELINFLCHRHLTFNLGPHINFIHGENGSGKSAILVAIQTCLGCKASDTNRGSSNKDLITDGESAASVIITIKNEGDEAYCPDIYGDRIIIQRRINRSGGSSYKIMDETQRKVSDKRVELANILDHLGIQVDNPCAILNQDTSREFLQAKGKNAEKQKYAFFERATQLDAIKNHVDNTDINVEAMKSAIKGGRDRVGKHKKALEEAQEELNEAKRISDLKLNKSKLAARIAWMYVLETEREAETLRAQLKKYEERKVEVLKRIEESKDNNLNERRDIIEKAMEEIEGQLDEKNESLNALSRRYVTLKPKIKKIKEREKKINTQIVALKKRLKFQQKELENFRMDANRDRQQELNDYETKVESLNQKVAELRKEQSDLESELDNCDTLNDRVRREYKGMQMNVRESEKKTRAILRQIDQLKKAQKDTTFLFGQESVQIVREIKKNARSFNQLPLGPLGSYVQVKKAAYASPVEKCIKKHTLSAFVVDDNHDREQLSKIMRRVCNNGRQPNIIVQRYSNELYNDLRCAEHRDFPSVYDSVTISSNWVARVLINQSQLESYLIADTKTDVSSEVMEFVKRNRNNKSLRGVFMLDGRLCTKRGVGTVYWQGSERIKNSVLTTDVSRSLNEAKQELQEAQQEEAQAKETLNARKSEMDDVLKQERKIKQAIDRVRRSLNSTMTELENVEAYKPEEPDMEQCEILEQEIEETENDLKTKIDELNDAKKDEDDVRKSVTVYQADKKVVEIAIAKLKKRLKEQKNDFDEFSAKFAQRQIRGERLAKRLTELQVEIVNCENMLKIAEDDNAKKRAVTLEHFGELGEPLKKNDTSVSLNREMKRVDAQINEIEKTMGRTDVEIQERFYQAQSAYQRIVSELKQLLRNEHKLRDSAEARRKDLKAFRMALATNATTFFNLYLSQQGHSGKLSFDHDTKTVGMEVTTYTNQAGADESKRRSTTDTKSLSGGERSSSTLAFIMALSEAMETPFRAMDEFDIFMDTLNRKKSMDALVKAAKSTLHRQFIFITPLGSQSIKKDKYMKIFELQAPSRNQGVLNFNNNE